MGSKKEKKHRKEKKSKKDRKDKRSGRGASGGVGQSPLADLLNFAILGQPKLMSELPLVLKALDDGEYVDVGAIRDNTSSVMLGELMRLLPVLYNEPNGWYKETEHAGVTQFVLAELQRHQAIMSAADLSMSQSLASKNVMLKLLVLLSSFPDLKGEFSGLLGTLLGGNAIQVDALDNEDIRDGLEDIFKAMGLERTRDGYGIPEGRKEELVREAIEHLVGVFENYDAVVVARRRRAEARSGMGGVQRAEDTGADRSDSLQQQQQQQQRRKHPQRVEASNSSGSSSDSDASAAGSSSSDDERDHSLEETSAATRKGPSMPTLEDLRQARALIDAQRREGTAFHAHDGDAEHGDSSSEDEGFGPQLCDARTARVLQASASAQPLGFAGADIAPAFERAFAYDIHGMHPSGDRYTGEKHQVVEENKREEWILTPGDSSIAASMTGAGLTNRKFQAGKQAKKLAEKMSIQREFQRQQQEMQAQQESAEHKVYVGPSTGPRGAGAGGAGSSRLGAEDAEPTTEELLQGYREKRGLSLMEQHLLANKKSKTAHDDPAEKNSRKAFDRERDLLSHSRMDEHKVAKLVQNAKELDDRFDKAAVQKSFL